MRENEIMNCLELEQYLLDYVDNELPGSLQQVVEEHLQTCLGCRKEVESYRKTAMLLQLRAVPEPPEKYWDESWEKIQDGFKARVVPLHENHIPTSRWMWLQQFDWRQVASIAAVVALIVVGGFWSWQSRESQLTQTPPSPFPTQQVSNPMPVFPYDDLPQDVIEQMELLNASGRGAFGSFDPVSKSVVFARVASAGR